jgi:DnaJ-class molecular chaperone
MARKDYYLLLGISRGESSSGIRKAFRDLARRHHPDHAGPAGTPMFRDVVEAYRVLSDPQRRREYDAELGIPIRIRTSGSANVGERASRSTSRTSISSRTRAGSARHRRICSRTSSATSCRRACPRANARNRCSATSS